MTISFSFTYRIGCRRGGLNDVHPPQPRRKYSQKLIACLLFLTLGMSTILVQAQEYTLRTNLFNPAVTEGAQWGSVGVEGDVLVVGAFGDTVDSKLGQGSVYVYTRQGLSWKFQQRVVAADGIVLEVTSA